MSVKIESVKLTPQTANCGQTVLISVKVQVSTYERLKAWTHRQLARFTHKNLANDLLK